MTFSLPPLKNAFARQLGEQARTSNRKLSPGSVECARWRVANRSSA
jgi:hypothetical protein